MAKVDPELHELERDIKCPGDNQFEFPYLYPMLVMRWADFKQQGKIMKSTWEWRKKALDNDILTVFNPKEHIAVFISHRSRIPSPSSVKAKAQAEQDEADSFKFDLICDGINEMFKERAVPFYPEKLVLWIEYSFARTPTFSSVTFFRLHAIILRHTTPPHTHGWLTPHTAPPSAAACKLCLGRP